MRIPAAITGAAALTGMLAFSSLTFSQMPTALLEVPNTAALAGMIQQAQRYLRDSTQVAAMPMQVNQASAGIYPRFTLRRAIGDRAYTTLQYTQTIKGLERIGKAARFHFDAQGKMRFANPLDVIQIDTSP